MQRKPPPTRTATCWTPAAIRKATPFPKPQGAIGKASEFHGLLGAPLDPVERAMLRRIAEEADLIDAGQMSWGSAWRLPRFWLLVPADDTLIDFLATFEVERADDLGADTDTEQDTTADLESEGDDEPEEDREEDGLVVTAERRARYRETQELAACESPFRPLRVYRAGGGGGDSA